MWRNTKSVGDSQHTGSKGNAENRNSRNATGTEVTDTVLCCLTLLSIQVESYLLRQTINNVKKRSMEKRKQME